MNHIRKVGISGQTLSLTGKDCAGGSAGRVFRSAGGFDGHFLSEIKNFSAFHRLRSDEVWQ